MVGPPSLDVYYSETTGFSPLLFGAYCINVYYNNVLFVDQMPSSVSNNYINEHSKIYE